MKCFSLFSGIGGFDLALKNQNHTMVGACEIDKHARSIYERHFPGVPIWEDATKINPDKIPEFDLLCAGFPCQAFSISGKRKGFNDTRGSLFFEIARILKEKQPSYFLLENVKGLLNHDKGNTFRTILKTLDEVGYDVQWQIINSKNHGVPQNRERVFLIGNIREKGRGKILPIFINNSENIGKEINENIAVVMDHGKLRSIGNVSNNLDANYWKGMDNHGQRTMIALTERRTLQAKIIRKEMMKKGRDYCPRREKKLVMRGDNLGNCLTTGQTQEQFITDGIRIRRLTPLECERLQGFPDNYTNGISDTQRYKCLGNAVTVPVIEYIIGELYHGL